MSRKKKALSIVALALVALLATWATYEFFYYLLTHSSDPDDRKSPELGAALLAVIVLWVASLLFRDPKPRPKIEED